MLTVRCEKYWLEAEPFKQWLARVGYERMQEIADPAQSIDRARENWKNWGAARSGFSSA